LLCFVFLFPLSYGWINWMSSYFIMLHFARGFLLWNHNFVGSCGVRGRVNGANVPHQHPRLTCTECRNSWLPLSIAEFITRTYARTYTPYIFMIFCKKSVLFSRLQYYLMWHIIQCIKWLLNRSRESNLIESKRKNVNAIYICL